MEKKVYTKRGCAFAQSRCLFYTSESLTASHMYKCLRGLFYIGTLYGIDAFSAYTMWIMCVTISF